MADKGNWWKNGIVYQIYPASFKDSTGNGKGDLRGIIGKLDYIKSLGINMVWLNPVYSSPNDDNGYDISDYYSIMQEFGTMDDMDALIEGMKSRGIRLIMDLVANHTSDEHHWFKASRSSRDNPYRNYYHWWPAEKGDPPQRWSYFDEDSNAWAYDPVTDAYYLHYFSKKQPDLNWENPRVRQAIYDVMRFWFNKGVDGFRMDVMSFISKDTTFPELPARYNGDFISYYADGPNLHQYLREMNREVLAHYDVMTVGEAPGIGLDRALEFVDESNKELDMFFHFDLMSLDREGEEVFTARKEPWKLTEFKQIFTEWDAVFSERGWGSIYLNNHDFPRAVSRWGNDSPAFWYYSATMLHTFMLTMRGTPFFYYGEEIGMTNIGFTDPEDYRDINSLKKFEAVLRQGGDLEALISNEIITGRDNARTPMQWDNSHQAGFSSGESWIKVNQNYRDGINVAFQESQPDSVLNYFRKMVRLRQENPVLVHGEYALLLKDHEAVYAYTRTLEAVSVLVLLNFSPETVTFHLPESLFREAKLWIKNDAKIISEVKKNHEFVLSPYRAVVYEIT